MLVLAVVMIHLQPDAQVIDRVEESSGRLFLFLFSAYLICGAILAIEYIRNELRTVSNGASAVGVFVSALTGILFITYWHHWHRRKQR